MSRTARGMLAVMCLHSHPKDREEHSLDLMASMPVNWRLPRQTRPPVAASRPVADTAHKHEDQRQATDELHRAFPTVDVVYSHPIAGK